MTPRAPRKRAAAGFRPAFEPQRASARAKDLLLFELQRARVAVQAAVQGVAPASAEQPLAPGKWTLRETVLHLAVRDRVRLEEFDAVLAGADVSWLGADDARMAEINEAHLAPLRAHSWDAALRLLQTTRDQLMTRVLAVPPDPDDRWTDAHPFGRMLLALPPHDRKHALQIKNARTRA